MFQKSIKKSFRLDGKGLHFGKDVKMIVHPASADHGIVFRRTDIEGDCAYVKASFENVSKTYLRTQLTNRVGVSIISFKWQVGRGHLGEFTGTVPGIKLFANSSPAPW